MLRTGYFLTRW